MDHPVGSRFALPHSRKSLIMPPALIGEPVREYVTLFLFGCVHADAIERDVK